MRLKHNPAELIYYLGRNQHDAPVVLAQQVPTVAAAEYVNR